MGEDTAFVVVHVAVPAACSIDLFDDPVEALSSGIGNSGFEEDFDVGPPSFDRGRELVSLSHVGVCAGLIKLFSTLLDSLGVVAAGEQGAKAFFAGLGRRDLAVGVLKCRTGFAAVCAAFPRAAPVR